VPSQRRIVITGIGVVSALGSTRDSFWNSLLECRSGVRPIERVDTSKFRFHNGCEVAGYNPLEHFDEKKLTYLDLFAQFALVAAKEAIRDSGAELKGDRSGVITGSGGGGQCTLDQE